MQNLRLSVLIVVLASLFAFSYGAKSMLSGSYLVVNYDSGVGDYYPGSFSCVSAPFVNMSSFSSGFTIELWTSPSFNLDAYQPIVYYGSDINNYFLLTSSNISFATRPGASDVHAILVVNGVKIFDMYVGATNLLFQEGTWNHLAVSASFAGTGFISVYSVAKNQASTITFTFPAFNLNSLAGSSFLIGGFAQGSPVVPAFITQPYAGAVDEVRVWSVARSSTEVTNSRAAVLSGTETGFYSYFSFDDLPTSGATTLDAISGQTASLVSYPTVASYTNFVYTSLSSAPPVDSETINLNSYYKNITFSGSVSPVAMTLIGSSYGQTKFAYIVTAPSKGQVCFGSPCTAGVSYQATSVNDLYVGYTPLRDACGTSQQFSVNLNNTVTPGPAVINFYVGVSSLNPSLDVTAYSVPPATGGSIQITGSNFGLDGPLSSNENVKITIGANVFDCTSPVVSGGNKITCNVAGGFGAGTLSATLCSRTIAGPTFAYNPPAVSYLSVSQSGVSNTSSYVTINVVGANYGVGRTFTRDGSNYVNIDGNPCSVLFINDTFIQCTASTSLTNGVEYTLTVALGGQLTDFVFNYTLCLPNCLHGGICTGFQQCDCSATGYEGSICEIPLTCSPPCRNNGTCVLSTETVGAKVCRCAEGWTGQDCGTSTAPPTIVNGSGGVSQTLIIAIAVPVGFVFLVLIGLLVFFFVFRSPKRGTKNFIPLEKKDFTKIIYGEQLNSQPEKTNAHLDELEKMLVQDDLKLAFAVSHATQITEADKIAKALVIVFQDNNKIMTLLESFIDEEVKNTESAGTLFRSNSMVSKMFKFYSRMTGLPYLYTTIGPEIDELISAKLGLEVDPEKMEEGTDLDEMRWMLMAQSQKLLKFILNSSEECPTQFRILFAHLKEVVGAKFAENVNTTIGGFIFLRFFCPAISSPEAYGILEEPPTPAARRLLILITKVLQNLSNDVEFGSKEPYMAKMNDFIQSNRVKLAAFYEKLIKSPTKPNTECQLPQHMKKIQLTLLASHIRSIIEQIEDPELKKKLDTVV